MGPAASATPASRATIRRRPRPTRTSCGSGAAAEPTLSHEALVTRHVFFFGNGAADGSRDMKSTLGGKGANLAEMTNLGVPVPPGFTIAAQLCGEYLRAGG